MVKAKPIRTCVGCNKSYPKDELIRIALYKDVISIDSKGKANGRGVYLCKNEDCLKLAVKRNAIKRAFGKNLSEDQVENLIEEIQKNEENK